MQANQDARARQVLEIAYQQLQQQTAKISDAAMRRSFLENVPIHREIVAQYHANC
jgi:hypothetical protein